MGSNEEQERLLPSVNVSSYQSVPEELNENVTKRGLAEDPGEYTFEEAVEHFGFGRFQIRLILSTGVAVMSDAVQLLAPAVLGNVLECGPWQLSKVSIAWLTTVIFFAKMIFSPVIGWAIDKTGRRKGLLFPLICAPIFAALGSLSPNYPCLLASRFLVGAALSGTLQICGYIEEFLPATHRRRAMLSQLFWPFGGLWTSGFG